MKHHSTQREYWRSLEHMADSPLMQQIAQNEFVGYDPDDMMKMSDVTRRGFMKLVSASMALAGLTLTGCRRWPTEKLTPYTSNPHNRVPGVPEQYATIMEIDGVGSPLLVTSFDGRPIKIEGNPSHPFAAAAPNIGAASVYSQASVLEMYDPQRSRGIVASGSDSDWAGFTAAIGPVLDQLAGKQGNGLAILFEPLSGPSAQRLKAAVAAKFPKAKWCGYAPLVTGNEAAGLKQAAGKSVRQMLHLNKAQVIVSIDADLLGSHPAKVRYAGDWAAGRRSADEGEMSRVYVAESTFSTSGTVADMRLAIRPSRAATILIALAGAAGITTGAAALNLSPDEKSFVDNVAHDLFRANDLANANPVGLIAVGEHLPPECHALALAINNKLGNIGSLITLYELPDDAGESLADLTGQMKSGAISTLIILGGNPAYDAPADLEFASTLKGLAASVHLSLYQNETSQVCKWHVPRAHYLEAWGDARAWDGTISVCQPLIEPLFDGKTCEQILAMMAGESPLDSDAIVRKTFASLITSDFESNYRRVLNDGLLANSGFAEIGGNLSITPPAPAVLAISGMEVRFIQDASLYDGRFAPNGWLQELPDPLTKVVWDNPALLSIKDAQQLGVESGDVLNLTIGGRGLTIAAFVQPGQPEGVIGLSLGYGRTVSTHIGTGVGFNTYTVRSTGGMYSAQASQVAKTGETYALATTQNQHLIDDLGAGGRDDRVGKEKYSTAVLIHEVLFSDLKDPTKRKRNEDGSIPLQLFDSRPEPLLSEPHAWGMAIDMTSCIGCHACVVACQAENNIPIVGKDNVLNNREMHWIRIDRYFKGDPTAPEVVYQPMTCQQCENAPCEQVCPVGATMHDTEGLNVMVYNRCVGTRYCSNNCPYKVRRFNFLDWHAQDPRHDKYPKPFLNIPDLQDPQLTDSTDGKLSAMVFNPEVTVRMRGVMEKCTYCIQRVHNTQTAKRANGEELKDGDIVTACQQTCPTQAIVFGDLNDPNSKVSQLHRNNRAYGLLAEELNTRPRNRYLAKVSNPPEA
jgi:molybdopterin-containing oxidoreductase family iron-sulfur binding subunit